VSDFSLSTRHTFLAGALVTAGLLAAGCSKPGTSALTSSPAAPAASSSESTATQTQPSASTTSARPRPHRPTHTETASAGMIIKSATVPVLCYHQLPTGGAATAHTTARPSRGERPGS
jgi:hypothetical protein